MPTFLAITSRGLLEPLTEELKEMEIKYVKQRSDCVEFEGSWAELYRVHLKSRIATRILMPIADFVAYNEDDLYKNVFKRHDFTKYITPQQTLRIESHVRENRNLSDQRFVALKTKDAIVDQFWKKYNERPSVGDEEHADLRVVVRVVGTQVSLAIDLTGDSLSLRGYRRFAGEAPLREHVAAGMLKIAKWEAPTPIVDPFCGSGTLLIEAALSASQAPAMKRRRQFTFEKLRGFQQQVWLDMKPKDSRRAPPSKPFLFGYDKDPSVVEKARANARAAGVENWILFQQRDVRELKAPAVVEPGILLTNPPYGERLGDKPMAIQLMADFSKTLKENFKGWNAWVLSGDSDVSAGLKLKAVRRAPVWNGPIECRLLNYPIT